MFLETERGRESEREKERVTAATNGRGQSERRRLIVAHGDFPAGPLESIGSFPFPPGAKLKAGRPAEISAFQPIS